jgi:transposase
MEPTNPRQVLQCTNCKKIVNRDFNAATNIRNIAISVANGDGRPDYLKRPQKSSTEQSDCSRVALS